MQQYVAAGPEPYLQVKQERAATPSLAEAIQANISANMKRWAEVHKPQLAQDPITQSLATLQEQQTLEAVAKAAAAAAAAAANAVINAASQDIQRKIRERAAAQGLLPFLISDMAHLGAEFQTRANIGSDAATMDAAQLQQPQQPHNPALQMIRAASWAEMADSPDELPSNQPGMTAVIIPHHSGGPLSHEHGGSAGVGGSNVMAGSGAGAGSGSGGPTGGGAAQARTAGVSSRDLNSATAAPGALGGALGRVPATRKGSDEGGKPLTGTPHSCSSSCHSLAHCHPQLQGRCCCLLSAPLHLACCSRLCSRSQPQASYSHHPSCHKTT